MLHKDIRFAPATPSRGLASSGHSLEASSPLTQCRSPPEAGEESRGVPAATTAKARTSWLGTVPLFWNPSSVGGGWGDGMADQLPSLSLFSQWEGCWPGFAEEVAKDSREGPALR